MTTLYFWSGEELPPIDRLASRNLGGAVSCGAPGQRPCQCLVSVCMGGDMRFLGALCALMSLLAVVYGHYVDSPRPIVLAHRGSRYLVPENTLLAYDTALAFGADVLELDVRDDFSGEFKTWASENPGGPHLWVAVQADSK